MSDLPAITGAGGEFKIGEKTWRWTPLTIRQRGAFEAELREILADRLDVIGAAAKACDAAKLKGDDRKSVLEVAAKEHLRLRTLGPSELIAEFEVPDADAVFFRHHLLTHHPELTLDECKEMMAHQVLAAIMRVTHEQAQAMLPGKDSLPKSAGDSASLMMEPETGATKAESPGPAPSVT